MPNSKIMNKEAFLESVAQAARENIATREEVLQAYEKGERTEVGEEASRRFDLSDILYYLGGGIVVLGIGIFIAQNWEELNVFTRIIATLGAGVAAYGIGAALSREERTTALGQAFHLIAGFVLPIGLFVTLHELGADTTTTGVISGIYAFLLVLYLLSHQVFRQTLFLLLSIIFGTLLFFAFTGWLASDTALFREDDFLSYRFLITGLTYVLLGYALVGKPEKALVRYLYVFGLLFFLGAALALGGYFPDHSIFWELVFPGLALGAIFLSLPLRSRTFLLLGSFFLIIYILKITAEYFADSFGWPLALVLAGFAMIGVGTLFVRLNRKYKSLA
jgi:uncharacterized membrane protein